MTEKTVNYTDEMVTRLVEAYDGTADVETRKATVAELADEMGKSTRSIVAKLSTLGVYVKPERVTKDGKPITRKEDLATELGELLGMSEADATSMAKANKSALVIVLAALRD